MKKKGIIIIAIILVVTAVSFAASFIGEYTRSTSGGKEVTVSIPKGASERAIAAILKDNGVIKYELSFRLKMKNSPYRGQLNYGNYVLKEKMCLDDIIETLLKTTAFEEGVKLTVPEGFSAEMIAQRCETQGLVSKEEFLHELENGKFEYDFINEIPKKDGVRYRLQGYLFPSTYMFDKNADAHKIINTLLGEFEKQYKTMSSKNMSMNDIIIRASLIEREAKLDSERRKISGVIQNRLDIGMGLQIDASVVYAISDGMYDVERVLYKDLEVDSPYNTYKYAGIPIGAICNPGIESIKAAISPEEHSYLYYHTDTDKNDGSHIFSETFSQHVK